MLMRRFKYPNTTGLILRRSLKELEQSHIHKIFEEWPQMRVNYNEQKKKLVFPETNSVLYFGSAPTARDVADLCSSEYADIMPDEAQEFSQDELERMSASNRCTSNPDIVPKMIYTFMPGGSPTGIPPRGLQYLKRVFIERDIKPEEKNNRWAFVQAFSWDNIEWARQELTRDRIGEGEHQPTNPLCPCQECEFYSWPEADRRDYFITRTNYGANLASLTNPYLRDAWLYGKWDIFEGQYFQNFDPLRHVITAAEAKDRIKPWHTKWVSGDWGFNHPHAIYWHVKDEQDRVITYREQHAREMSEQDLGELIGKYSLNEKITSFPFSVDAGRLSKRDPGRTHSIAAMIGKALPQGFPRPHPIDDKPGTRVSGWRLMSQFLDADMWQIVGEDCPKLVECLPTLVRDPDNTEDVLKVDFPENGIGDDPADAARYGLFFMFGSAAMKPFEVRLKEALQAIPIEGPDRFIKHKQMELKERTSGIGAPVYLGGGPRRPRRR